MTNDVKVWEDGLVAATIASARHVGVAIRIALPQDGWADDYPFTLVERIDDGSGDMRMVGLLVDWINEEGAKLRRLVEAPTRRIASVMKGDSHAK